MAHENKFKNMAVESLRTLRNDGIIFFDDKDIDNVRDLCSYLGVSSKTLYNWDKGYPYSVDNETTEDIIDEIEYIEHVKEEPPVEWEFNGNFLEHKEELSFNINRSRFLAWLGGEIGIPNANRLHKNELLLRLGLHFIKKSGLVDTSEVYK